MEKWRKIFKDQYSYLKNNDNLTQKQLANLIGVRQATISYWLNGSRSPETFTQFQRLALFIKLNENDLLIPFLQELLKKDFSKLENDLSAAPKIHKEPVKFTRLEEIWEQLPALGREMLLEQAELLFRNLNQDQDKKFEAKSNSPKKKSGK